MTTKQLLRLEWRSWRLGFAVLMAACPWWVGCERQPSASDTKGRGDSLEVRGNPITTSSSTNSARATTNAPFVPADFSKPDRVENGLTHLSWDKLSGFKFDVYEVSSET